jgi:DNA-binding protein H-NS
MQPEKLEGLSLEELDALAKDVAAKRLVKLEEARAAFARRIAPEAASLGLRVRLEPLPAVPEKPRKKARVIFRDPETGEESTGRGKRAKWLQAKIDQGRDIEEFRVKPEDPSAGGPRKRSR